jgi:hypothetical protein
MKNLHFLFIILLFTLIIACQKFDVKISEPSAEETQRIKTIGDTLSAKLLKALKNELSSAIEEKGAVNAIQVCNIKALPITEKIANTDKYTVDIKRTTNQFRNPTNKPNDIEQIALEKYEELVKNEKPLPEFHIQKITDGNIQYYNYFKPIKTSGLCLLCHGDANTMDKSLKDVLNRLYPNDLATGYKDGDFRALLRIKIMDKD